MQFPLKAKERGLQSDPDDGVRGADGSRNMSWKYVSEPQTPLSGRQAASSPTSWFLRAVLSQGSRG